MKYFVLFFLSLFLFSSCEEENFGSGEEKLVIEGWIETGKPPVVILTKNVSLASSPDLWTKMIRWAKVTVSDGNKEIVLVGMSDNRYFPPYIYTSHEMPGEVGKTYTLRVEYQNHVATAVTTILPPIPLDSLKVEPSGNTDDLFQIKAYFTDPPQEQNYYRFFTRVLPDNKHFYSSFLGCFDDSSFGSSLVCAPVYRGKYKTLNDDDYTPFFRKNEKVVVRFTQLNEPEYKFWTAYENAVNLSGSMFFPSHISLPSNVKGGIGCWSGYGAKIYEVDIATGSVTPF